MDRDARPAAEQRSLWQSLAKELAPEGIHVAIVTCERWETEVVYR